MEILKFVILVCCTYITFASEHTHIIPVEKYDTELHDLGQHVEVPETPVRVVKITKTIAVKIPVPYPVKVIEKVPYPVHVSKPYPVPVPQIVKVPHVISAKDNGHEALDSSSYQGHPQFGGNTYQVQENPTDAGHGYSGDSGNVYHGDVGYGSPQSAGDEHISSGEDFSGGQASGHYGYPSNHDANAFESKSYDQAIKNYLQNHGQGKSASVPHY